MPDSDVQPTPWVLSAVGVFGIDAFAGFLASVFYRIAGVIPGVPQGCTCLIERFARLLRRTFVHVAAPDEENGSEERHGLAMEYHSPGL